MILRIEAEELDEVQEYIYIGHIITWKKDHRNEIRIKQCIMIRIKSFNANEQKTPCQYA